MGILLVENRTTRQDIYLKFQIDKYNDILDNHIEGRFDLFKERVQQQNFDEYSKFEVICIHKSAFNADEITIIREWCNKEDKKLVFFSGGITTSKLVDNELQINSRDFYSLNLEIYLDSFRRKNAHLLMIQFGNEWELSLLLSLREALNNTCNQILESNQKRRWNSVRNYRLLEKYLPKTAIEESEPLTIDQLKEIVKSLNNLISALVK